jgi:hypothetical protein
VCSTSHIPVFRNNREVDIAQGVCPEAGFPLCCRFISEEKFRDLLSLNGYIWGKREGAIRQP